MLEEVRASFACSGAIRRNGLSSVRPIPLSSPSACDAEANESATSSKENFGGKGFGTNADCPPTVETILPLGESTNSDFSIWYQGRRLFYTKLPFRISRIPGFFNRQLAYHPPPPRPPPPPPEPPEKPEELDELLGSELVAALVALAIAEETERPKLSLDQLLPRRQRAW